LRYRFRSAKDLFKNSKFSHIHLNLGNDPMRASEFPGIVLFVLRDLKLLHTLMAASITPGLNWRLPSKALCNPLQNRLMRLVIV
jgi:hypothetical protein